MAQRSIVSIVQFPPNELAQAGVILATAEIEALGLFVWDWIQPRQEGLSTEGANE
jgi:hypothetical protein